MREGAMGASFVMRLFVAFCGVAEREWKFCDATVCSNTQTRSIKWELGWAS